MKIAREIVQMKHFTFTPEESEVLADVLFTAIDWEIWENGEYYDFFEKLHQELLDQAP